MSSEKRFSKLRMQFIEAAIIVHGVISRGMICSVFGVATPTASLDLKAYREQNSGLVFNYSMKQWERGSDFQPSPGLLHMSADTLLLRVEQLFDVKIKPVAVKVRMPDGWIACSKQTPEPNKYIGIFLDGNQPNPMQKL
ncbi:hypothetical protein [Serratia fonticola]|uniref:hypothetical protein n=1 Tax=Serratia fonticola TaxID=47917 RepID=UPI00301D45E8